MQDNDRFYYMNSEQRENIGKNIKEAADYLRVSVSTMRKFVQRKEITYHRIGRKLFFDTADLDAFIRRRQVTHMLTSTC